MYAKMTAFKSTFSSRYKYWIEDICNRFDQDLMWKISIRIWINVPHLPTVLCALYYCFLFSDWSDEAVTNAEILRLIYQGRFLHCNVTLSALGLATGKTTVMHLVPRENLPEPNSQGMHCVLYAFYVFAVNISDSRVPIFPTLKCRNVLETVLKLC